VQDSGCGISTEEMAHVFEPFFSTKGTHGTGLGLAVSWGIVESHGGRIEVESTVGEGSRFTVRLPMVADKDVRSSAA
jgi:two-component system NtrC family sensor kinase